MQSPDLFIAVCIVCFAVGVAVGYCVAYVRYLLTRVEGS